MVCVWALPPSHSMISFCVKHISTMREVYALSWHFCVVVEGGGTLLLKPKRFLSGVARIIVFCGGGCGFFLTWEV